jgi:lysophospholipase L1-like esterase
VKKNGGFKISLLLNIILCVALAVTIYDAGYINGFSPGYIKSNHQVQYEERMSMFSSVPTTHADVVFLGDSITQNGIWNEFFPDVSLVNRGIKGDTTSGILSRLSDVLKLQPQKIFLMVGVNDIHLKVPANEIYDNYKKIVETIRKKLPRTTVYIQSVLPIEESKLRISNADIDAVNAAIKKLANGHSIIYIDINSKLKTADNQLNPKYTVDGEHIKGQAYKIWVDQISRYI